MTSYLRGVSRLAWARLGGGPGWRRASTLVTQVRNECLRGECRYGAAAFARLADLLRED